MEPMYHEQVSYAIIEFNEMMRLLFETYPDYSMKQYRDYIISGLNKDGFPDTLCQKLEYMKKLREETIEYEIRFNLRRAQNRGKTIREEYLTGKSLDVFFLPIAYEEYFYFRIFKDMSWYDPIEMAQLAIDEPLKNPFEE